MRPSRRVSPFRGALPTQPSFKITSLPTFTSRTPIHIPEAGAAGAAQGLSSSGDVKTCPGLQTPHAEGP